MTQSSFSTSTASGDITTSSSPTDPVISSRPAFYENAQSSLSSDPLIFTAVGLTVMVIIFGAVLCIWNKQKRKSHSSNVNAEIQGTTNTTEVEEKRGFRNSATYEIKVHGHIGKGATITCSHSWATTNTKYFCRHPCGDKNVLVKSDQSPTGRYTLKDSGNGTFTVNITDLQESDSGTYWCGVWRAGFDTYIKVNLTVSKDPSENITTSTQLYKDIQTSTDPHTSTPTASKLSTTASKITRYSSTDDITISPSAKASVNTTVYILCVVGGLLIAVIIFAVGLVAVHQHRKNVKTSATITLPNESKAEQDDCIYENEASKTNSTPMKPINRTMTRQVQKSEMYSVYENLQELCGNL
ncbi:CMRF35-like molecule 5 isoform X1 [Labeo rohita]|uniref:CMRF35-like molecule 5 isoform X1 n=1 Tax=Labeo rohita TaxID=84645 RepID=A0A498MGT2_LABRO|nr:CMRF35-like molecule 5 isoform X1 [Labeo rohita]